MIDNRLTLIFRFLNHVKNLLTIPGASIAFGGDLIPSKEHSIPSCYGSWNPTAVKIPIKQLLLEENFSLCTTEIFGGFQIIVDYNDDELHLVLEALERVDAHLTAAVVSNDVLFQNKVLAHTVNGTTYCGIRARTTGTYTSHTHTRTHNVVLLSISLSFLQSYFLFNTACLVISILSFSLHLKMQLFILTSVLRWIHSPSLYFLRILSLIHTILTH